MLDVVVPFSVVACLLLVAAKSPIGNLDNPICHKSSRNRKSVSTTWKYRSLGDLGDWIKYCMVYGTVLCRVDSTGLDWFRLVSSGFVCRALACKAGFGRESS